MLTILVFINFAIILLLINEICTLERLNNRIKELENIMFLNEKYFSNNINALEDTLLTAEKNIIKKCGVKNE